MVAALRRRWPGGSQQQSAWPHYDARISAVGFRAPRSRLAALGLAQEDELASCLRCELHFGAGHWVEREHQPERGPRMGIAGWRAPCPVAARVPARLGALRPVLLRADPELRRRAAVRVLALAQGLVRDVHLRDSALNARAHRADVSVDLQVVGVLVLAHIEPGPAAQEQRGDRDDDGAETE